MPNLLANGAAALLGRDVEAGAAAGVRQLLETLDYVDADAAGSALNRHRAKLLEAASRFTRVFQLAAPDAPGLVCVGAEFDPGLADPLHAGSPVVGVSGVGLTLQQAFQGCIGEGIEYLSQLQSGQDSPRPLTTPDPSAGLGPMGRDFLATLSAYRLRHEDPALSWLRVRRLSDSGEAWLPADICLRRPASQREIRAPFPLSTGSAAGLSWEAAALHGLLELIERDAASLWWQGGDRGGLIPPDHDAACLARDLLPRLRQGVSTRRSWLLDITTDIGIPCVAALSCLIDGFGLACGLSARPTLAAAARAAILEMCQGELAQALVEAKARERGAAALNDKDRDHRLRATMLNANRCELLWPVPMPREHSEHSKREHSKREHPNLSVDAGEPGAALALIVGRLAQFGIETFGLYLTRSRFAVPVARIVAPGLQLKPSEIVTARLADKIAQTGGGAAYTDGVALL